MLLCPKVCEDFWEPRAKRGEAMHSRMTGGAQNHEPIRVVDETLTMMDMERRPARLPRPAPLALPAVPLQDCLAIPAEPPE